MLATQEATRFWTDHCGHAESDYVGSFTLPNAADGVRGEYDVYYFRDMLTMRNHVCIRFSDEPSHYISAYTLDDARGSASVVNRVAAALVDAAIEN